MAKTEEELNRQIENSAIGSWAGYIYQGICGLIESVELLIKNRDSDYILSLDAFEDFAILNSEKKIVSLHQCKDIKGRSDYSEAFKLMKDKRDYYANQGLLASEVKLYFHCNNNVVVPDGIELYPFKPKQTYCSPEELPEVLKSRVQTYLDNNGITKCDADSINGELCKLIEIKVLEVQNLYFKSKTALKTIAKTESQILLTDIRAILDCAKKVSITSINYGAYTKALFLKKIDSFEDDLEEDAKNKIAVLKTNILRLDNKEWEFLLQRINPDTKSDVDHHEDVCNKDRVEQFVLLLESIEREISKLSDWITPGGKERLSPSTLRQVRKIDNLCEKIWRNRANLDVLNEYDCIIADIKKDAESIKHNLPHIIDADEYDKDDSERVDINAPKFMDTKDVSLISYNEANRILKS